MYQIPSHRIAPDPSPFLQTPAYNRSVLVATHADWAIEGTSKPGSHDGADRWWCMSRATSWSASPGAVLLAIERNRSPPDASVTRRVAGAITLM
jgi:hypothetical protein